MTIPLAIVLGLSLGLGLYIYQDDNNAKDNWCSTEVIQEVRGCSDIGCIYILESGGLEANHKSYKVGDEVEVCRHEKPQKDLPKDQ